MRFLDKLNEKHKKKYEGKKYIASNDDSANVEMVSNSKLIDYMFQKKFDLVEQQIRLYGLELKIKYGDTRTWLGSVNYVEGKGLRLKTFVFDLKIPFNEMSHYRFNGSSKINFRHDLVDFEISGPFGFKPIIILDKLISAELDKLVDW